MPEKSELFVPETLPVQAADEQYSIGDDDIKKLERRLVWKLDTR